MEGNYVTVTLCLYLCLCLSVTSRHSICRNGWTDRAGFWHGGFLWHILHCVATCKEIQVSVYKNKGTFLLISVLNSGLSIENFATTLRST